jgi:hypothetical protein
MIDPGSFAHLTSEIETGHRFLDGKFPVLPFLGNSPVLFNRTRGSYCRLSQLPSCGAYLAYKAISNFYSKRLPFPPAAKPTNDFFSHHHNPSTLKGLELSITNIRSCRYPEICLPILACAEILSSADEVSL